MASPQVRTRKGTARKKQPKKAAPAMTATASVGQSTAASKPVLASTLAPPPRANAHTSTQASQSFSNNVPFAQRAVAAVRWALLAVLFPLIDLIAMRLRPLAMTFVVLPLSAVLRVYFVTREYLLVNYLSTPHHHADRVTRVQAQVKARQELEESDRRPMCTARAPWQNLSTRFADYKARSNCIYVGDLDNILDLNIVGEPTVRVEPLCQVGEITRFLVQRGYMMATTLEIEEATIGGLAMAVGMTTASHKYGLLQETVVEYEMVLGDGRLVNVRADNHPDLYYALPWSHGSLGLLVGLTLRVVPVKPFVRVTYHPFESKAGYTSKIKELALQDVHSSPDFIEATIFSRQRAVVMEGRFEDDAVARTTTTRVNNIGWWWKPWFYKHVQTFADNKTSTNHMPQQELIPTLQYIFRHNRAIFWTLRDQLPERVGNHPLFRLVLGWTCPPYVQFLKMFATSRIRKEMRSERVYQDIVLPLAAMDDAIDLSEETFDIYPVLVYPSRIVDHGPGNRGLFPTPKPETLLPGPATWFQATDDSMAGGQQTDGRTTDAEYPRAAMFFDLGVYGIPRKIKNGEAYDAIKQARKFESFTQSVGGAPFLYADTFFTRAEFEKLMNMDLYESVRAKYAAEGNFPHVYDKTTST